MAAPGAVGDPLHLTLIVTPLIVPVASLVAIEKLRNFIHSSIFVRIFTLFFEETASELDH
jgi:hypothetical protein